MEAAILDVMNEHFVRQMQEGRVVWTPVNIEDPATKPLQQKLAVRSNGLVLARMENGVYRDSKKLDELWGLKDRPEVFSQLLVDEIEARLTPVQSR
jgi:putative ubiquitin-RnfH superfamily antitoxin RatB of RatAB toxin-antitoxin module